MKNYPYYPPPVKNKVSSFMTFFKKKSSWLDGVYERSYTMRMGEIKLPGMTVYIPNKPDFIHRILVSEVKLFPKHALLHDILSPLLGESIFTTNGEVWKKQRELLTPSFEMVRVSHVFGLMNEAAQDMMTRLANVPNNAYYDMDEEMTFVTADIIFRTILSKKLTQEEAKKIVNAFALFQELSAKVGMHKMFKLPNMFNFFSGDKERLNAGKVIRDSLSSIIQPRYTAMTNKEEDSYKDILASLLKVVDEETGKAFSFTEILDQISMLFLAGHETSASSMTWTLYLLALYPDHQEKAYQEIVTVCGDDAFTADNTKQLYFATNVIKESLRLYPPVSFFARESKVETSMGTKVLKAGATVIISPWLIHRNERYWEDAHMFDSHRFDNPENITKNTYLPFGLGQRICIGQGFAMQESVLLLATILREYKLELKEGFVPHIAGRLTTRSLNGMPIKLIKRI